MISIRDFAVKIGMNPKALDNRVRKAGVQSVGIGLTADGKKTRLFPLVELERLAEMKMYTRKHNYYRISVYDEYSECYWVRAAGLTKKEAEKKLQDYLRQGIMAKMIVCGVENGNKVK